MVGDHLGSASVIVYQDGTPSSYQYYSPFGGNRGDLLSPLTTKRYTGQYHEEGLPGGEGLSYYGARWYDAQVGRFVSPDTIVPNPSMPNSLNRYSYVQNNPIRYIDPTGHALQGVVDGGGAPPPSSDPEVAALNVAHANTVMKGIANDIAYGYLNDGASWSEIPVNTKARLERYNWNQSVYEDDGVSSMAGTLADPAVIASGLFGVGRLAVIYGPSIAAFAAPYITSAGQNITSVSRNLVLRAQMLVTGDQRPFQLVRGRNTEVRILQLLGQVKNTMTISSRVSGRIVRTIPDILNHQSRVIGEIKDVAKQTATRQIRAQAAYASELGYQYRLYVRPGTTITPALQRLVDEGAVRLFRNVR